MKTGGIALTFAIGLVAATGLVFWLAVQATMEWQRSTQTAADTHGNEVVTLLALALERDMKGGEDSVLLPFVQAGIDSPPYEIADRFARGFARFPYLDSFLVWRSTGSDPQTTYVFSRADRRPTWDESTGQDDPYPVVFRRNPASVSGILERAQQASRTHAPFALFETSIGGHPYQTLVYLTYEGSRPDAKLSAVAGFLVDMARVKAQYFSEFIQQVHDIVNDPSVNITISDERNHVVAAVGPESKGEAAHVRRFPLVFADPALLADLPRTDDVPSWTAQVAVTRTGALAAESRGAARTLALAGLGALATIIGLILTVRATHAEARLVAVQSEFISAVSHEMKTPLSLLKLASDTLATGRYDSPRKIADYGQLMAVETGHLSQLIDNVLCYARLSDAMSPYSFEAVDIADLVHESVDRFRPQFERLGFAVQVDVPPDPIMISGDHTMMVHVVDSLLDNAAKHAASGQWLRVVVAYSGAMVLVQVSDHGPGIAAHDLPRVFERFYRGAGTRARGAGLGLAITKRIVSDH
ncbi:MAG TPA: HAMP domain-containing sensor histidine kinase, partial [Vicinamibacterales bacterium]|nr:HAMP domain-containing sensor histidine kinase [Vicinamibacterales bacterium]